MWSYRRLGLESLRTPHIGVSAADCGVGRQGPEYAHQGHRPSRSKACQEIGLDYVRDMFRPSGSRNCVAKKPNIRPCQISCRRGPGQNPRRPPRLRRTHGAHDGRVGGRGRNGREGARRTGRVDQRSRERLLGLPGRSLTGSVPARCLALLRISSEIPHHGCSRRLSPRLPAYFASQACNVCLDTPAAAAVSITVRPSLITANTAR
jgi:hypothetical protein